MNSFMQKSSAYTAERERELFLRDKSSRGDNVCTNSSTAASARSVNVQLWRQVHKQIGALQINYIINFYILIFKIKA